MLSTKSWQQEMREAITSTRELASWLNHQELPETSYKNFIPRTFAKRISQSDALKKQFLPDISENSDSGLQDPIADHLHAKVPGLIHRYQNRALFLPTDVCPITCRYCFRKNELGVQDELFKAGDLEKVKGYLREHQEIEEIIFTGGDPLILSNKKIEHYMNFFARISSVKMIRFHTRTPVILPQRIDQEFIELMKSYQKRFDVMTFIIHTNHVDEWGDDFTQACHTLNSCSTQVLSQSVLLKGVNDNVASLKDLFHGLVTRGVRPYYLHHPDQAKGAMHFYLEKEIGLKLYAQLKKEVSGWALPHYVCEQEEGRGKILTSQSQLRH